ncbi:MAG: ABC transporter ATP-binding protein, partial [Nitrospirota bacterium]
MSSDRRPEHILELRDASFSYERKGRLIEGLALGVGEADFVGLLGANGSGKSTILKLLAGILRPSSGEVNLWGKPIASLRNRDRAKLVSYLPQTLDMRVPFTAGELAAMGLYPYESPPALSVEEALEMVGLADKRDTPVANLSGGERRRAYIAMTLLQGAGILLLDELHLEPYVEVRQGLV